MTFEVQIHCAIPTHITLTEEMALHLSRKNLIADGYKTLTFPDQPAFFHYVRSFNYTNYSGSRRNHFLDATMCHINESRRYRQSFDSHRHRPNYIDTTNRGSNVYFIGYLTHDDTGRVIDMRNYTNELYSFDNASYKDQQRLIRHEYWEAEFVVRDALCEKASELREGKDYWSFYRRIRTTQERRYSASKEHKPFIRGRRSCANLPDSYDDLDFHREKSWKARDKKARSQWAVKFKKHIDTANHPPIWSEDLL